MSGTYAELLRGRLLVVLVDEEAQRFFDEIRDSHFKYIARTRELLARLSEEGRAGLPRAEHFVLEDRFSTGAKDGSRVAVYAVKAFQLRVYGGFCTIRGERSFICIEAAIKKTDKADQKQLKRVARKLGDYGADLE